LKLRGLPREVRSVIFSHLPIEECFKVVIQHRSNIDYLKKIREYARLDSTDEAIEFLWKYNGDVIQGWHHPDLVKDLLATWGEDVPLTEDAAICLESLQDSSYHPLRVRENMLYLYKDEYWSELLSTENFESHFGALGLLASSPEFVNLSLGFRGDDKYQTFREFPA